MKTLVVVPARKNSKGLPGKNTIPCAGKPLVEWTLDLLPHLDLPDFYSVVSTDCPAVTACAERKGVPVLKRPDYLATDDATTLGVLQHAVAESGYQCDAVLCLQPTNPLRTVQDVSSAYRIMVQNNCDSVSSWTDSDPYEQYAANVGLFGCATQGLLHKRRDFGRRQDVAPAMKPTGEIYLTKRSVIEGGAVEGNHPWAYYIPRSRAWNIDEPCDIPIVEALLRFNGRV